MDIITHVLLGATLARATALRPRTSLPDRYSPPISQGRLSIRERVFLGGGAAAFPDVDFVGFLFDPLRFLADWHQAATHSFVLWPLWSVMLAVLYVWIAKRSAALVDAIFVCLLAIGSHILADVLTAYGTAVLYPLSSWRASLGTTFVIDPVFTGILAVTLWASLRSGRRYQALVGLMFIAAYVTGQAILRERALDIGRESLHAQGLNTKRIMALPQPFSPFNWKLVASLDDGHHVTHVNIIGHPTWVPPLTTIPGVGWLRQISSAYVAPSQMVWNWRSLLGDTPQVRALSEPLWHDPRLAPFRRFAAMPALSRVDLRDEKACVWFTDLRYDLPATEETFRYGFCRFQAGPWILHRLRYLSQDERQALP